MESLRKEGRGGRGYGLESEGERGCQLCSILWADTFWIMCKSKRGLERIMKELIEEVFWDGAEAGIVVEDRQRGSNSWINDAHI